MLILSFVSNKWRKFIIPITAIAVVSAFLFFPREQSDNEMIVMSGQNPFPELIEEIEAEVEEDDVQVAPVIIVVDVKGAVRHPGVYSMQEGDRIIDAITAAGGYLPDADSRMLNHAMKLIDEFVVYVPVEGEEAVEIGTGPVTVTLTKQDDDKININTANEGQLMTLPGIGPAKAEAIILYRNDHGLFSAPESLMDVSGIGKKTFEKLVHQIKVK